MSGPTYGYPFDATSHEYALALGQAVYAMSRLRTLFMDFHVWSGVSNLDTAGSKSTPSTENKLRQQFGKRSDIDYMVDLYRRCVEARNAIAHAVVDGSQGVLLDFGGTQDLDSVESLTLCQNRFDTAFAYFYPIFAEKSDGLRDYARVFRHHFESGVTRPVLIWVRAGGSYRVAGMEYEHFKMTGDRFVSFIQSIAGIEGVSR